MLNSPDQDWANPDEREFLMELVSLLAALMKKAANGVGAKKEEVDRVNELLARYPYVVELVAVGKDALIFADFPVHSQRGSRFSRMVITLARQKLLDRFRRCAQCGKWLFASRPKKRFCSAECQQAKWRSTAEFKEHNREYQRTYYRDVLSPNTAKHLQAKRRGKKV
jgi:hypothetical protein